jgi:hypothetical protein
MLACFSKPRKGRKAAELVIANKELLFKIKKKEKELLINHFNKELASQKKRNRALN